MDTANSDRVLVLVSGGIDSSILCKWLHEEEGKKVLGLFIDRGQGALCNEWNALNRIKDDVHIKKIYKAKFDIKQWRDMASRKLKDKWGIPGRNMIMVALAIPYAVQLRCPEICIASLPCDFDSDEEYLRFLDCTVRKLTEYMRDMIGGVISVRAPFVEKNMDKPDIIEWASRHQGSDFLCLCYSCWRGSDDEEHCGQCKACDIRKQAFGLAKVEDRTSYRAATGFS